MQVKSMFSSRFNPFELLENALPESRVYWSGSAQFPW